MRTLIIARNRTIGIEHDRICTPEGRFDMVLRCPDSDVRPGLINAHDHLHRNHYGRLGFPPYANASHWAADIQNHCRDHIAQCKSSPDAYLAGAWKNLFAGVTSVVHHDPWDDQFDGNFPIRVIRLANADSLEMTPGSVTSCNPDERFALHLAEGVDAQSADEARKLDRMGLLCSNLLAVHCVGLDDDAVARFRKSGAALVWCPTSNLFLFGQTAPEALFRQDVDVLLGSDALLTAQGDLLDELKAARALRRLGDDRLELSVGAVAAKRLGLPPPALEPGSPADVILMDAPLIEASAELVSLVIVNGVPRVARSDIASQLGTLAEKGVTRTIGGRTRWTLTTPSPVYGILQ